LTDPERKAVQRLYFAPRARLHGFRSCSGLAEAERALVEEADGAALGYFRRAFVSSRAVPHRGHLAGHAATRRHARGNG
jgi:hypothetical protein